jgi:surface protein
MGKITYITKNKAGTGDALLWKDTDANEVKTSVNAIYDTTLTITGTTNQITATGGVQNLESNRLWTISLPTNICTGIISATTCFVGSGAGLTGTASSLTAIPASHTHGDISNTGTITSIAITPASGDYILLSDTTASGSIKRGIVLGSSTTTFLANNGTWLTPAGGVSEAMFNSHTGDSTIHFTQAQISITESQISNLGSYATTTNFNSHTGNTDCHFTQANISITTSQVNNLSSYTGFDTRYSLTGHTHTGVYEPVFTKNTAFNKDFGTTTGTVAQGDDNRFTSGVTAYNWGNHATAGYATTANLNSHTGDSTIHYTQANISITKSQVSDFGTYQEPLVSGTNIKTINSQSILGSGDLVIEGGSGVDVTTFNAHTGDTSIHYAQSAITITESQISDLGNYLTSETDPIFTASAAYGITSTNITNWNTAYGWGDHSVEGYLTVDKGVTSLTFSGTDTKTLTLTLRDNTQISASFTDLVGETGGGEIVNPFNLSNDVHVSVWDTTKTSDGSSNSDQIRLPITTGAASQNFYVDWGDGYTQRITDGAKAIHTYATAGVYQLTIVGEVNGFGFNNTGDKEKLLNIRSFGKDFKFDTVTGANFYGCTFPSIEATDLIANNASMNAFRLFMSNNSLMTVPDSFKFVNFGTSLTQLFYNCNLFNDDINDWAVSNVEDFSYLFYGCDIFNKPLDKWDMSNATDLSFMFFGAAAFNQDISMWDTSKVTNMSYTFVYCDSLVNAPTIGNSVVDMIETFAYCTSLVTAPTIGNSVENMTNTFHYCINLVNAPTIPDSVLNMSYTFYDCNSLVDAPTIGNSVVDMSWTFAYCNNLVNAPTIPNSVENMSSTFNRCSSLVNAPTIGNSVVNMSATFSECTNLVNAPTIPNSVVDMSNTFSYCNSLVNAPTIPNSVENMSWTFAYCNNLVNAPTIIGNSVVNMSWTFAGCTSLTGDITILSPSITNFTNCFFGTSLPKTVYVPAGSTTFTTLNAKYGSGQNGVTIVQV